MAAGYPRSCVAGIDFLGLSTHGSGPFDCGAGVDTNDPLDDGHAWRRVLPGAGYGPRQISSLLAAMKEVTPRCDTRIVCGDFNATLESEPLRLLRDAGFHPTHRPTDGATCNPGGVPKMIDFVLCDGGLEFAPRELARVTTDIVLPSTDMPSDHVPVAAMPAEGKSI